MKITDKHKREIEELVEEAGQAIGTALYQDNPYFLLKAINDQIKADGLDDDYELNEKGKRLQSLYEEIYRQEKEAGRKDPSHA